MSSSASTSSTSYNAKRDPIRFTADGERVIRVTDNDRLDRFETIEDDSVRAYKNTPTADRLPGFGDEYDTCGDEIPHFCSECGHVPHEDGKPVAIGQTCWRKECPRCANGWAMRAGIKTTSKIESLRSRVAKERGDSPRFHHVVVSMPSFAASGDADAAFKRVTKEVIEEVSQGLYGGVIVHHSHRGREGDDRGAWKERLFEDRDWTEDVEDELKVSHHAHVIVLADRVDGLLCEAVHDQTGIVTTRITKNDSNVSLYDVQDLASATTYALSHARVADDAYAYEYFGEVANHSAEPQTQARMRRVVRSVVPQTLGLNVSSLTCEREQEDGDSHSQFDGAGGDGSTSTSTGPLCGGRLIPIEYAPTYVEDHDLEHEAELLRFYESWDPPD